MAEMKTKENEAPVDAFLDAVENKRRQEDAFAVKVMMEDVTGWSAKMWGSSMVGFGAYEYKYDSGREGRLFITGFSPRKANLVLYIMNGFSTYDTLLGQLGKHKTGKSCLYVNKLADVDMDVLADMVKFSVDYMVEKYGIKN